MHFLYLVTGGKAAAENVYMHVSAGRRETIPFDVWPRVVVQMIDLIQTQVCLKSPCVYLEQFLVDGDGRMYGLARDRPTDLRKRFTR